VEMAGNGGKLVAMAKWQKKPAKIIYKLFKFVQF
jgi:hypothetical protein